MSVSLIMVHFQPLSLHLECRERISCYLLIVELGMVPAAKTYVCLEEKRNAIEVAIVVSSS